MHQPEETLSDISSYRGVEWTAPTAAAAPTYSGPQIQPVDLEVGMGS